MEKNYRERDGKIRIVLCSFLILFLAASVARADPQLFLLAPDPYAHIGKPVVLDIYLYNDGTKPIKVPPLLFARANWTLTDTSGKAKGLRVGGSRVASDHGTPDIIIAAGAVLYERKEFDVGAEAGDVVEIKVQLGKSHRLESNSACIYFQKDK